MAGIELPPILQAHLELELQDSNGFIHPGFEDIAGCLNGVMRLDRHALSRWLATQRGRQLTTSPWYDVRLLDVQFNANGFLHMLCQTHLLGFLSSRFELQLDIAENGALRLQLGRHLLPAPLLLQALDLLLKHLLETRVNGLIPYFDLGLISTRHGRQLLLIPCLRRIAIPIREGNRIQIHGLEDIRCLFRRDADRNLELVFDQVSFLGSSDPQGKRGTHWNVNDRLKLQLEVQAWQGGQVDFKVQGSIELNLSEQETRQIQLQGHALSEMIEKVCLQVKIDTQASLSPQRQLTVHAQNTWHFRELSILGRTYQVSPTDLVISFNPEQGLQITLGSESLLFQGFQPNLSLNALKLIINGPAYLEDALRHIRLARRSIDLETFLYFPGGTTRRLTHALALKAAGLQDSPSGLIGDPLGTGGIPVRVLFSNLELLPASSQPVIELFESVIQALETRIRHQPGWNDFQRQRHLKALQQNLQYYSYVEGVARADHRKLLVVDGESAWVGGINLGDKFLGPDSFHDLMVRIQGPAVRQAHEAFFENWWRVTRTSPQRGSGVRSLRRLHEVARRAAQRLHTGLSPSEILLTDTHSTRIAEALLYLLNRAEKTIWLEHAYFYHPPTLEALKRALERNVQLCMIFPENSNIALYNLTNTENIRQLMEHQQALGRGSVQAWLYTGIPGEFSQMAHTKALCVDSRYVLVGSANLTSRSLHSPFREALEGGNQSPIFFNQEMNLYIEDPHFAQYLEQELFLKDIQHFARALDYPQVLERLELLGGASALHTAQLQARLT